MTSNLTFARRWQEFLLRLHAGNVSRERTEIGRELATRYAEPHRRYHTITHILQCLHEFHEISQMAEHPAELEMAIFFHDAVYNAKAMDNEEQSARLASEAGEKMNLPQESIERIVRLIEGTKIGKVPATPDERLMEDIDYSILGQPESVYDAYVQGVRAEYHWVSQDMFGAKRGNFLRGLLEKDSIYYTGHFGKKYNKTAKENIRKELLLLKK